MDTDTKQLLERIERIKTKELKRDDTSEVLTATLDRCTAHIRERQTVTCDSCGGRVDRSETKRLSWGFVVCTDCQTCLSCGGKMRSGDFGPGIRLCRNCRTE